MTEQSLALARTLFRDFSCYREQTTYVKQQRQKNPFIKSLSENETRLKLFDDLAQWCSEHKVEPRAWLFYLFAARHWSFPPRLTLAHLCSETLLSRHSRFHDYQAFREYLDRERAWKYPLEKKFDPNVDLTSGVEALKCSYQAIGRGDLCMALLETETFGYHPQSPICGKCSVWTECLHRLRELVDFDILALRTGRITALQARETAFVTGMRYGRV